MVNAHTPTFDHKFFLRKMSQLSILFGSRYSDPVFGLLLLSIVIACYCLAVDCFVCLGFCFLYHCIPALICIVLQNTYANEWKLFPMLSQHEQFICDIFVDSNCSK